MSENEKGNLKLIVRNREDLKVISAYSQDSIVAVEDITFLRKNRIFVMIINRFMWEDIEKGINRQSKRIRCALKFEGILKVKSKKINQKNKKKRLECLAIECNDILNKNNEINFFFAGGGIITLISESIEATMCDLGESWNVKHTPKHKI
tara:strand:+ start:878 stop:1327 length:450 start_codon:yes stop_codon:yes gene_type:complete